MTSSSVCTQGPRLPTFSFTFHPLGRDRPSGTVRRSPSTQVVGWSPTRVRPFLVWLKEGVLYDFCRRYSRYTRGKRGVSFPVFRTGTLVV